MSTIPMEYRPKDTGRTTNILLANNHLAIAQVAILGEGEQGREPGRLPSPGWGEGPGVG